MYDIDLLPPELKNSSLSNREIVLTFNDIFKAIEIIKSNNWAILGWEVWIKTADGRHGHPLPYVIAYTFNEEIKESWESYVIRTSNLTRETINKEKEDWDNSISMQFPGCEIYFCISADNKK